MSRDLVTYYGQTNRIDSLVGKYGPYLEQLDRETKLLLRITIFEFKMQNAKLKMKNNNFKLINSVDKTPLIVFNFKFLIFNFELEQSDLTLAHYAFMQQFCKSDDYSVLEALQDALFVRFICEEMPRVLPQVCSELEGITIDETETILDALQHQLHWGNARLLVNQ
ncbi:hypothetical protein [Nostoc sp. FACHB-145]|uniref:hypothetical protein n=1 Tax=Nostoc sp. FACHB-145 TaxID=2692836 RepID=UPI001684F46D|nr:hypothetical protein [Nostoc sp. FACHB-145]MBD2471435.1 hypothetical protein [Nostoc sp. FACHB-145]